MTLRRRIDVERLREAIRGPGADTRVWCAQGRVEDPDESLTWDPEYGWLVDVEIVGGDLHGESDVPCRVPEPLGGDGYGEFLPPALSSEVVVLIPDGDLEVNPLVVARGHNRRYCKVPTEVTGLPISGDLDASTPAAVSPYDTEIRLSPHHRREEWEGEKHSHASRHVLDGPINLGSKDADEPVVLGRSQLDQLVAYIEALHVALDTVSAATVPPTTAAVTALKASWSTTIKPGLEASLSSRVQAE